jgi:hypothetical protein
MSFRHSERCRKTDEFLRVTAHLSVVFRRSEKRVEFLRSGTEFWSAKGSACSRKQSWFFQIGTTVKRQSYSENRQAAAAFLLNSVPEENGVKGNLAGF